jgi:chemotaxis protein MotB
MGSAVSGEAEEITDAQEGDKSQADDGQTNQKENGDNPQTVSDNRFRSNPGMTDAEAEVEKSQLEASEELAEQITEALQSGMSEEELKELSEEEVISDVILDYTSQYVELTISGSLLFDSGKDTLAEDAIPVLDKVGKVLESYAGGTIEVEGHTDNVPIHNARFSSNDELSSARALSVFYYLIDNTELKPENIKHAGRGDYLPVADNTTAEGRARNRRVVIRIYNPLSAGY